MSSALPLAALVILSSIAGCSSDDRVPVTGTVTANGKPLEGGAISFRPAPGNESNSSGTQIDAGQFRLDAAHGLRPGKYLVTIQAFKTTGRMVNDHGAMVREMVPINFRETGKLDAAVAPGQKNHFDFQLTLVGDSP